MSKSSGVDRNRPHHFKPAQFEPAQYQPAAFKPVKPGQRPPNLFPDGFENKPHRPHGGRPNRVEH